MLITLETKIFPLSSNYGKWHCLQLSSEHILPTRQGAKNMKKLFSLGFIALLSGCAASFQDKHHFATINTQTGEIANIFRVTVKGGAELSNTRYISGYYDERAVDLFFNEVKSGDLAADYSKSGVSPIFKTVDCKDLDDKACAAKQDAILRTVPVGRDIGKEGAFVMILSTSADAIASSIGSFAENEAVLQSALYLATRSDREQSAKIAAIAPIVNNQRLAVVKEIDTIFSGSPNLAKSDYLEILRAAAAGLAPDAVPRFSDEKEAAAWFAARPRGGVQ